MQTGMAVNYRLPISRVSSIALEFCLSFISYSLLYIAVLSSFTFPEVVRGAATHSGLTLQLPMSLSTIPVPALSSISLRYPFSDVGAAHFSRLQLLRVLLRCQILACLA